MKGALILIKLTRCRPDDASVQRTNSMKVIKGLKKMYKNMNWYNRKKLQEANFKSDKKKQTARPAK